MDIIKTSVSIEKCQYEWIKKKADKNKTTVSQELREILENVMNGLILNLEEELKQELIDLMQHTRILTLEDLIRAVVKESNK